jgi:hypothetical protein
VVQASCLCRVDSCENTIASSTKQSRNVEVGPNFDQITNPTASVIQETSAMPEVDPEEPPDCSSRNMIDIPGRDRRDYHVPGGNAKRQRESAKEFCSGDAAALPASLGQATDIPIASRSVGPHVKSNRSSWLCVSSVQPCHHRTCYLWLPGEARAH